MGAAAGALAESKLTLDHVLYARQVREDVEIVLGSPALLLHADISSLALLLRLAPRHAALAG